MPNRLIYLLLFILAGSGPVLLSAQNASSDLPDPELEAQPKLIVLTGIAPQIGSDYYRTFFISVEHPWTPYQNVGIQFSHYLPQQGNYDSDYDLQKGSFEVGLFNKFTMHGRLTGRRSHFYFAPQLRFGVRHLVYNERYYGLTVYNYRVFTIKAMFGIGGKYRIGRATMEWFVPVGLERSTTSLVDSNASNITKVRALTTPGFGFGYRL